MKKEIKKQIIEALKDGFYEQSVGLLRTGQDGFCFLGVLCDLYNSFYSGIDFWNIDMYGVWDFMGFTEEIPVKVQLWSGLDSVCSLPNNALYFLSNGKKADSMVELNDDGRSFDELAEIIDVYF